MSSYFSGVSPYFRFSQLLRDWIGLVFVRRRTVMHSCVLRVFLIRTLVGPHTEQVAVLASTSTSLRECLAVDIVVGYSASRPCLRIFW